MVKGVPTVAAAEEIDAQQRQLAACRRLCGTWV